MISRRGFILGAAGLVASPAIVQIDNIMPVRPRILADLTAAAPLDLLPCDGREVRQIDYPELFKTIGNFYGPSNPGYFRIPDDGGVYNPVGLGTETSPKLVPIQHKIVATRQKSSDGSFPFTVGSIVYQFV
jgi:hypothetical protein